MMGILGGLHVLRAHYKNNFMDPDLEKPLTQRTLPMKIATKMTNTNTTRNDEINIEKSIRSNIWRRRVDFNALVYAGLLGFLTCTTYLIDVQFPYSTKIKLKGNNLNV